LVVISERKNRQAELEATDQGTSPGSSPRERPISSQTVKTKSRYDLRVRPLVSGPAELGGGNVAQMP
jgi:hypothetical protein